jgi:hypothetical protein
MIGETMFVSGIAMFLSAPIVGRLMAKYDMRYLIAITSAIRYDVCTHETSLELADSPAWICCSEAETT